LLERAWETETVVYDPRSGSTHLLDEVGWQILLRLQRGPSTMGELLEHLGTSLPLELDDALRDHVRRLLAELGRLRLIDLCDP
jgi:PqqD family protein of HPr-rel-A system